MFRRLCLLAAALAVLAPTGCTSDRERSGLPPLEEMNVLLILVDTLRADDLGCYGSDAGVSPNIDALAEDGVVFKRTVAPSPWTQPSISSLLTGLTPSHHGTLRLNDLLPEENVTIAERFKERGFDTVGVVSQHLVRKALGYGQGFDVFDESSFVHATEHSSMKVTRAAINRMRMLDDDPFFMLVHYFDPHSDYLHHEAFDRTSGYDGPLRDASMKISDLRARRHEMSPEDYGYLHDLYREEIAFTDRQVGMLLDRFEAEGLLENTLVILTADHGEEFGEHGWIGHTRFMYDTLIHVPLIVSMPGRLAPAVVETPVSLLDVPPTFEALSDAPQEADWDGESLLPLLAGKTGDPDRPLFSEVAFVSPQLERETPEIEKEAFLASVSSGPWKLIHDLERETWELYDLRDDPGELSDLYDDDHDVVQRLRPQLVEWEKDKVETWGRDFDGVMEMDEKERERLRSLGYIH